MITLHALLASRSYSQGGARFDLDGIIPGVRAWQGVVFALCAIGLLAIAESAWATYNLQGDVFGSAVSGPVTSAPFFDHFDSVVSGSVGERAGIRGGDAIDLRLLTRATRYWERNELLAARPIRLAIVRDGTVHQLTVRPEPYTQIPFWASSQWLFNWAFWLGSALSISIAALLMWRRPDSAEVRLLALTLVLEASEEGGVGRRRHR